MDLRLTGLALCTSQPEIHLMIEPPTHTECGECRHRVKLKRANWELWTDNDKPVGISQQRKCNRCQALVIAGVGTDEFITMLMKHFGPATPTH